MTEKAASATCGVEHRSASQPRPPQPVTWCRTANDGLLSPPMSSPSAVCRNGATSPSCAHARDPHPRSFNFQLTNRQIFFYRKLNCKPYDRFASLLLIISASKCKKLLSCSHFSQHQGMYS